MKNDICGTYWLCRNDSGNIWLTQGNRPTKTTGGFQYNHTKDTELGWLQLYNKDGDEEEDWSYKDGNKVKSSDYHHLKFPEVPKGECIEIEIGKSGRVYTYD